MRTRANELQFIYVFLDLVLLNLSFIVVAILFPQQYFQDKLDVYSCFLIANLSWILAFIMVRKYVLYIKKGFTKRFLRMLKRVFVFLLIVSFLFFLFHDRIEYLKFYLLISLTVFLFNMFVISYLYYRIVKFFHLKSKRVKRTLLVGENDVLNRICNIIKANPILDYMYIDTFFNDTEGSMTEKLDELENIIEAQNIHVLFVAVKDLRNIVSDEYNQLLSLCNRVGVRLFYVPDNQDVSEDKYDICRLANIVIFNPQYIPMDSIENQVIKRMFDLVFSGFVIVSILSWLYPILALLIKLGSKGPVLFVQERTGINGITFNCYKFRSMLLNPDADLKQAVEDDPRITKIGKFIRKTNIDELPQFFNVFKGEMSVVGPRPHMLAHTEQYSALIDNYLVRHYVKPGITGWAQVNGYRGETNELWKMERRVEYDKEYIENWSLDWDCTIVWKTVFALKAFVDVKWKETN